MMRFARGLIAVLTAMVVAHAHSAIANVLWTEDAESGTTNVIDGTDASYLLIQSDIVSQGNNAFHLANPGFSDNWFEIDQSLTIESDTKLFFTSRLNWATSSQVAKVQLSTDGGSSWPTDIFSQAGDGGAGEGAFGLKEIDLSSYSGQQARFRFYYDFTDGSAFPQTTTDVGWKVDDIQFADEFQKQQYSIGSPSADAQLYLEYVNRARADALVEANRLAAETDADILSAYSFFNIDTQDIVDQFTWYVNSGAMDQVAQPLSFNADLNTAAELHTLDMFNNQFQGHDSSFSPPAPFLPGYTLGQRADAVGYNWTGLGENVFSSADSVPQGHAGFDVDWGNTSNPGDPDYNPAFVGQGMQNPAGHRRSIHNDSFKEVGIGVINGTNGSVGPQLVTQDFGDPGDAAFVTGVVYDDLNSNNFYDIGEGRSGVRVDVDGSAFFAISSDSGGYSVPVDGNGLYDVMFTGGGFASYATIANVVGSDNVKVDYVLTILPGDFDGDGDADGFDFLLWQRDPSVGLLSDWEANYGAPLSAISATVPEPTTCTLALAALCVVVGRRRSA
jgi:uncharacterized protein YkwD